MYIVYHLRNERCILNSKLSGVHASLKKSTNTQHFGLITKLVKLIITPVLKLAPNMYVAMWS